MNNYRSAYKGKYIPVNPQKWSHPSCVCYRSSIEYRYMRYYDLHPDVIKIASEKVIIPYTDPLKNTTRRYIVDLLVQFKTRSGTTQTVLIEIKSFNETVLPKVQKVITEAYKQKVYVHAVNQAKWAAATKFCEKRGWKFLVFTDRDMK